MYALTKKSFETLFPLLRPGGLYIIEDWAWGHWQAFQASDHPWSYEVPLTKLIFEIVAAIGSCKTAISLKPMISNQCFQRFVVIEREGCEEMLFRVRIPGSKSKLSRVFLYLEGFGFLKTASGSRGANYGVGN
jgi:hypothetical protein